MKLRNKKTGKIVDLIGSDRSGGFISIVIDFHDGNPKEYDYTSLAELNEEWEDCKPKEPLIKDKKIRKAVRAWAEANRYSLVKVGYDMASEPNDGLLQIHFEEAGIVDDDKFGIHTIAELCGEEEEPEEDEDEEDTRDEEY